MLSLQHLHPVVASCIRVGIAICVGVFGIYLFLALMLYIRQSSYVYFPLREVDFTPKNITLDYKDVEFSAADGVKLHGWFIPRENSRGVILLCHGNGGNIGNRLDTIDLLHKLNLDVFIFDYRGYGRSEGKPSEQGTYADAEAAWDYIDKELKTDPKRIIVMGRSLGAAIASYLATQHTPAALIVESAFTSIPDIGADVYPYLPVKLLARFDYNTSNHLKSIDCPVLVVHSPSDDIIPYKHGQKLFEDAKQPKQFLEITGSHNSGFLDTGEKYINGLDDFITKYLE